MEDDGIGLPDALNLREPETLGMQLINDLARQINGAIDWGAPPGARITLSF